MQYSPTSVVWRKFRTIQYSIDMYNVDENEETKTSRFYCLLDSDHIYIRVFNYTASGDCQD